MNIINGKLPIDFNWKEYLDLNDDVRDCYPTKEGAINHYLQDGIRQNRIYKKKNLPNDFDWEIYLAINPDVYSVCKNKISAIMHYENHGFDEKRKYRFKEVNIPNDFDWENYCINNPSLNIHNKITAVAHYYKIGKRKKLSYSVNNTSLPVNFVWKVYTKLNNIENICTTKESAIKHYLKIGKVQKLDYQVPRIKIPPDFNWITYVELNTDVKQQYNSKSLAEYHYFITGQREKRIYKYAHVPHDFNHKIYLEINPNIPENYKVNEYTVKLHYDLFGYGQSLCYKYDFSNLPNNFDWEKYRDLNTDLKNICCNELQYKNHYSNYGIYQNRSFSLDVKKKSIVDKAYGNFPFLFHKYILNISEKTDKINYEQKNKLSLKKKYLLVTHIHCYNIDIFDKFFKIYFEKISQYSELIIITYSIGTCNNNKEKCIHLKCLNKGMDIGGKFVCIDFLKTQNIKYDSILFLHSKTDDYIRKLYCEPLINSIDEIISNLKDNSIGIYVPPLIYMGDYASIIYKEQFVDPKNVTYKWNFGNSMYLNELDKYHNFNPNNYCFPEGNCFICKSDIAESLYGDKHLYNLLNDKFTIDIVWIKALYGTRGFTFGNTIEEIYQFFQSINTVKLYPNNIAWGAGHEGHADNMFEHSFERIVFKVVQKLRYKIKILPFKKDSDYLIKLEDMNNQINQILGL